MPISNKKQMLFCTAFMFLLQFAIAQKSTDITVNQGELYILPNTTVATHFDFENTESGVVFNDGEFHFLKNYNNNGLYTYTSSFKTGKSYYEGNQHQLISGNEPSKHYDIIFNNNSQQYAFDLSNDIIINGTANFDNGIVKILHEDGGKMLFGNQATHIHVSDISYAEGMVEKLGNQAFEFPIGEKGHFRASLISAPQDENHLYQSRYFFENSDSLYPHKNRTSIIKEINDTEYWVVEQSEDTNGSVILTLTLKDETTTKKFMSGSNLHIVRWDKDMNLWVDEGGVISVDSKSISTPVAIDKFGVFTVAKVKEEYLNPGDVVIYQGVTPNNDGLNDYFIIDNINLFPENNVTIYNRWGKKVYETSNYNSNGNVFKGFSEHGNVKSGEMLPTGTYYYVVEYLYDRDGENQWIKKVGFLHLENNQ